MSAVEHPRSLKASSARVAQQLSQRKERHELCDTGYETDLQTYRPTDLQTYTQTQTHRHRRRQGGNGDENVSHRLMFAELTAGMPA
eukprot:3940948-Rhodomonas_salina.1